MKNRKMRKIDLPASNKSTFVEYVSFPKGKLCLLIASLFQIWRHLEKRKNYQSDFWYQHRTTGITSCRPSLQ